MHDRASDNFATLISFVLWYLENTLMGWCSSASPPSTMGGAPQLVAIFTRVHSAFIQFMLTCAIYADVITSLRLKDGSAGGSFVCGPKHNDSNAPLPPPPPPPPPPTPPLLQCPVPFGSSGGVLEAGTDHARAGSIAGM